MSDIRSPRQVLPVPKVQRLTHQGSHATLHHPMHMATTERKVSPAHLREDGHRKRSSGGHAFKQKHHVVEKRAHGRTHSPMKQMSHQGSHSKHLKHTHRTQHKQHASQERRHIHKRHVEVMHMSEMDVAMLLSHRRSVCASFVLGICVVMIPVVIFSVYRQQFSGIDDLWDYFQRT